MKIIRSLVCCVFFLLFYWKFVFRLPTSSIRKVVVPENSGPFGRLHPQVTFVTIPSGVQKIHVIVYERLKHMFKISHIACLMSYSCSC